MPATLSEPASTLQRPVMITLRDVALLDRAIANLAAFAAAPDLIAEVTDLRERMAGTTVRRDHSA